MNAFSISRRVFRFARCRKLAMPAILALSGCVVFIEGIGIARAQQNPRIENAPASPVKRIGSHGRDRATITIAGRAVDRDGIPVADAVIQVIDDNQVSVGDLVLGKTTTGTDGRYALRGISIPVITPPPNAIPAPRESRFEVSGWAPERAFTWHRAQTYRPKTRPAQADAKKSGLVFYEGELISADLNFGPSARVSGKITDDTGKPVAGAFVQVGFVKNDHDRSDGVFGARHCAAIDPQKGEDLEFHGVAYLPASLRSAHTDDQGNYAISVLPREATLVACIDYEPSYIPRFMTIATTTERFPGVVSLGYEGILNHTFVVPRTVRVRATLAATGQPAAGVTVTARGTKVQRGGSVGKTNAEGRVVLQLQPDQYRLRSEPTSGADTVVSEQPFTVANEPRELSVEVKVDAGAVVMFEAVEEVTGTAIAGVGFEYETDTTRMRKSVQSQTVYVDHPVTDSDGRLRVVMAPGTRRFFPVRTPGFEPVGTENPLLSLAPGKTNVVKFTFKKAALPDVVEQETVKNDVVGRLMERWKSQRVLIQRGRARVTRSVLPGAGIASEQLIKLLDSLDTSRVPSIFELIHKEFPDAETAKSLTLELIVDEPRRREDWVAPVNKTIVFNGRESVSYFPVNDQVDVADNSGKNPMTFQVQGIGYYCHLAGLNGDITERANGKVTLARKSTYTTARLVIDEKTGFVYRDSHFFRPGNESSQTEHWQFAPWPTPEGLVLPAMSIELNLHNGRINNILIKTIESIDLTTPISPETFVVSVAAGTSIIDYRDGRDDTDHGVVRSPVTDVVTRADEIAATWKRFVPPVKPGDQAPAIEPIVWLNRSGRIEAPNLKGKVVLVDFWGMTCGPCVAELPEVREAAERFAGTDLAIIGLHESSGTVEEVAQFAAKRGMTYPLAIDRASKESGWFGAAFAAYGIRGIPSAAVLDRQGRIVFVGQFHEAIERAAALLK